MHAIFLVPSLAVVTVRSSRELDALAIQTYIIGAVVAIVFLAAAAFVANAIAFEGGARPRDPGKRRMWYWLLLVVALIALFVYNFYVVAPRVALGLQSRFMTVNATSVGIALALYVVVGFVISKAFATSKVGNWYGAARG